MTLRNRPIPSDVTAALPIVSEREATTAFVLPSGLDIGVENRRAIMDALPSLGRPDSAMNRISVAATIGAIRLDLAKTALEGSWNIGDQTDTAFMAFLSRLYSNAPLQRSLGVSAVKGPFDRGGKDARHTATPQELTPELTRRGVFHVTRERRLGIFAARATGDLVAIVKTSDFVQLSNAPRLYTVAAKTVVEGGIPPEFAEAHNYSYDQTLAMTKDLRRIFLAGIEDGIHIRSPWLWPVSMSYQYVRVAKLGRRRVRRDV